MLRLKQIRKFKNNSKNSVRQTNGADGCGATGAEVVAREALVKNNAKVEQPHITLSLN